MLSGAFSANAVFPFFDLKKVAIPKSAMFVTNRRRSLCNYAILAASSLCGASSSKFRREDTRLDDAGRSARGGWLVSITSSAGTRRDVGQDGMPQSPVLISVKDQHNRSSSGGFCVGSKNEPKPRREAVYGHGQYATSRCSRSRLPWRRKSAEMCRVRVWVLSLDPCDVCLCRNRATAALLGETICSMLLPQ